MGGRNYFVYGAELGATLLAPKQANPPKPGVGGRNYLAHSRSKQYMPQYLGAVFVL